jgi:hypothetical protein
MTRKIGGVATLPSSVVSVDGKRKIFRLCGLFTTRSRAWVSVLRYGQTALPQQGALVKRM